MMVQPEDILSIHFDGVTNAAVDVKFNITTTDGARNTEMWEDTGDLVLMQFTGLLDSKGKEIYEGDVVRGAVKFPQLLTGDTDENCNVKMCGSVFYDFPGFSLKVIQNMSDPERDGMVNYFDFTGDSGETFDEKEIIGNIYENSDLIK